MLLYLFPDQSAALTTQYTAALAVDSERCTEDRWNTSRPGCRSSIIALRTVTGGAPVFLRVAFGANRRCLDPDSPRVCRSGVALALQVVSFHDERPVGIPSRSSLLAGPARNGQRDYNQVKALGFVNSTVRTSEQTEIGLFWTDHAGSQYSRAFRGAGE